MMANNVTRQNNEKISLIVYQPVFRIQKGKKFAPYEAGMPAIKVRMLVK